VTHYYITRSGLPGPPQTDVRLARLISLATQKFIADVAADAYQYSRIRSTAAGGNAVGNPGGGGVQGAAGGIGSSKEHQAKGAAPIGSARPGFGGGGGTTSANARDRTVLTMEDLGMAVSEYGVNVKRSEFYR